MARLPPPPPTWFHENHGSNVVLSNQGRTAERIKGHDHGIVMLASPMVTNRLYQIRLERKDVGHGGYTWLKGVDYMQCGVVIEHPGTLCLPGEANEWGYAVVINNNHVTLRGQFLTGSCVGKKLQFLPQGSSVGLLLDQGLNLHLYIDGVDQGVAIQLPAPFLCYAFFDLIGPYRKMNVLPVLQIL